MKTHGYVNSPKSARKHRKAGHAVAYVPSRRRWYWTSVCNSIELPVEGAGMIFGYSRERARRIRASKQFLAATNTSIAITGKKATGIVLDNPMYDVELNDEARKAMNDSERNLRKKTPLTASDISIGAFYMPRKCNAATKPVLVTVKKWDGITGQFLIGYTTKNTSFNTSVKESFGSAVMSDFLSFVSRRVW